MNFWGIAFRPAVSELGRNLSICAARPDVIRHEREPLETSQGGGLRAQCTADKQPLTLRRCSSYCPPTFIFAAAPP